MSTAIDPETFILKRTSVGMASLVPELKLYLACDVFELWQASEDEFGNYSLPPPYWAFAWPGGQALARLILNQSDMIVGRKVFDFGAGSGIAALAAAKAGASIVIAVDIDPLARAAMALNAALNGLQLVVVEKFDEAADFLPPDILLLGDMCYERALAEESLGLIRRMADKQTLVLLADPGRAYCPGKLGTEVARYAVPTSFDIENQSELETVIWSLP